MGIAWMLIAPLVIYFLVTGAIHNISATRTKDINKPVPWLIIITIFTPIAIGLFIFWLECSKRRVRSPSGKFG